LPGARVFPFLKCADQLNSPPSLIHLAPRALLLVVKWLWREADLSPASSAQINNEWSYTFTTSICFHGIYEDNLALNVISVFNYFDKISSMLAHNILINVLRYVTDLVRVMI
jgi:hypothetical protein